MKYTENLYIDHLYNFENTKGEQVKRYLLTFFGEEDKRYDIEIDFSDDYIEIVEHESDPIDGEDRLHLFYLLDRWAINQII